MIAKCFLNSILNDPYFPNWFEEISLSQNFLHIPGYEMGKSDGELCQLWIMVSI